MIRGRLERDHISGPKQDGNAISTLFWLGPFPERPLRYVIAIEAYESFVFPTGLNSDWLQISPSAHSRPQSRRSLLAGEAWARGRGTTRMPFGPAGALCLIQSI